MYCNYHTHTSLSDGKETAEDFIIEAIQLGMPSIGFTEHSPLPFNNPWSMEWKDFDFYTSMINDLKIKYKDKINVLLSLEIDYITDLVEDFSIYTSKASFDYILGSVHLVTSPSGKPWFIDGPRENFIKDLKLLFNNDIEKAVTAYYNQICKMISLQKIDIIAHLDKIKMNNKNEFFSVNDLWYQRLLNNTLEIIKENNCIVEVNTRGIYSGKHDELFPDITTLKKCFELDIPILISSDAHHPTQLLNNFEKTIEIIKEIGFNHITVYQNGEWVKSEI